MAKKLKAPGDPSPDSGSAQTLQRLRELKRKVREVFDRGQDRTAVAERIIDEMAQRQGLRLAPFFDWSLATQDFATRVDVALVQKPAGQSMEDFVQAFVDAWPRGMAMLRLAPNGSDPMAGAPYSNNGLWPADMEDRK